MNVEKFKTGAHMPHTASASIINTLKAFFAVVTQKYSQHNATQHSPPKREDHLDTIKRIKRAETDEATCDDEQLMLFLAEVQVTNPESIINMATLDELFIICNQVSSALNIVEDYLKTCTLPKGRDLYLQLIKGVAEFVDIMCEKDTSIRRNFMEHSACLKKLHGDFENCYGPADWTEDDNKRDLCCAYKQVADCYYTKSAEVCGKQAARAMRKVVVKIIDIVIPVHCIIIVKPCVDDLPLNGWQLTPSKMTFILIILYEIIVNSFKYLHLR